MLEWNYPAWFYRIRHANAPLLGGRTYYPRLKSEILIALTFASYRSSCIHASCRSNTPLILVLLHVLFWNDIQGVLSICKSYGHFTISPISSCTRCMRLASFTASPVACISSLVLLAEVIRGYRLLPSNPMYWHIIHGIHYTCSCLLWWFKVWCVFWV